MANGWGVDRVNDGWQDGEEREMVEWRDLEGMAAVLVCLLSFSSLFFFSAFWGACFVVLAEGKAEGDEGKEGHSGAKESHAQ